VTAHPHDRPARRLVLLRHGRTHWNHVRRAQGHADVPLDEVGRAPKLLDYGVGDFATREGIG
jgi:hypothetical protein